jgi:hypothetical protein
MEYFDAMDDDNVVGLLEMAREAFEGMPEA